jgi:hypothetical protein
MFRKKSEDSVIPLSLKAPSDLTARPRKRQGSTEDRLYYIRVVREDEVEEEEY